MGIQNVSRDSSSEQSRYIEVPQSLQDESSGGNDQEIELRRLNVRVLVSTDDLAGYDVLPIAQVRRSGEGKAVPQLDPDFVPPLISLEAWPTFKNRQVRTVFDLIGQKIEVLSEQISSRGVGLDSRHPGDLDRIMLLAQLNAAYAALHVISFTPGTHPHQAFLELCRIVGQLSLFSADRKLTDLPIYDHENLGPIFAELRARISSLIELVRDYEYEQRYFEGVGLGMQVALDSKWFNADWDWYIGVRKGDLTDQECRDLLSAGQLDWKLGSARQVEILFRNRAQGLEIRPLQHNVRSLPGDPQWLYYEIPRNDHPAWRDVQETETLAMRLKDSLIFNRDRLQGQRQLIVSAGGKQTPLEFALFAVPKNQ
jgi:type VI secretion system protein ImpJ